MDTTTTTFQPMPEKFRQTSACSKCGAPIYADADITKGKNGEVLLVLPTPYYTCACRFALPATQYIPYPVVPASPFPEGPSWDTNVAGDNTLDDGHRTITDGFFGPHGIFQDFFGSGGISQPADKHYVALLTT